MKSFSGHDILGAGAQTIRKSAYVYNGDIAKAKTDIIPHGTETGF